MLTIITGRGKSGKTTRLLEAVRACPGEAMGSRIVIVPEQLSHETERLLSRLCGDSISYASEVLSMTRLFDRVCAVSGGGARPTLDQGGRILTAQLALSSLRPQLKVFGAAAGKPEFLSGMVSMIDELKSYGVTPQTLMGAAAQAQGLFAQKLSELSMILGAYEAASAQGARDPRDKLTLLRKKLMEGAYAPGRHFFVDGFTDYSEQELRVLEALLRRGERMTVTVPAGDPEDPQALFAPGRETLSALCHMAEAAGVQVEIIHTTFRRTLPPELAYLEQNLFSYGASPFPGKADHITVTHWETRLEECRACAAVLRRHAMEGMRLRDMAIACGDEKSYGALLSSVMEEMGLPLYRNEKRPVLTHPAARFLLLALECAGESMEQEAVLAYLKTSYCGLDRNDVDLIENYVVTWAISGSKFFSKWTMHPEGYDGFFTEETEAQLQRINDCRQQAMAPLLHLSAKLKSALNVKGQMEALFDFLQETRLYESLEEQVSRETAQGNLEAAQETAQIWSILLSCLQQVCGVLGSLSLKSSELPRILELALKEYQVGTIPAALDAASFGTLGSMRGKEPKLLYVLGVNEGVIPSVAAGGSLLTEQERQTLRDRFGIPLAPDTEGNLQRQLLEIYGAFTAPTERLYLSYLTGEEAQPAFPVRRVMELIPNCGGPVSPYAGLSARSAAEQYLMASEENGLLPLRAAISRAAEQVPELEQAILLGRQLSQPREMQVSPETAKALFGDPVGLTASRMDKLASCPLDFFLYYGLKARLRKEATFDAAEFGTFVHFILEKTVPELLGRQAPCTGEESMALVASHMGEYTEERLSQLEQTSRQRYLLTRNRKEAALLVEEISKELATTAFTPVGYEVAIGGRQGLPPLTVQGQLGRGSLSGFVDRADLWHGPDGDYLRIIDYKTGRKKFDYTDLLAGSGMQMLLYLFALERSGLPGLDAALQPAGVLYLPARHSYQSAEGPGTIDAAHTPNRRSGLLLGEPQVLEAMEHGDQYQYMPLRKTKSGLGDYAVSRQQLRLLEDYVNNQMLRMTDQILGGGFAPAPFYRGISHDPCRYCDFGPVCQKDPQFRKSCYHPPVSAKAFWQLLTEGGTEGGEENG